MEKTEPKSRKLTCEETGRLGGIATAKKKTPQQHKRWAKAAARKRWAKNGDGK